MTFVCIPGGPAVFSHGNVAPVPDCCLDAPATEGVFGTMTVRLTNITAAIPTRAQRLWCTFPVLLTLGSDGESGEAGSVHRVLLSITSQCLFITCVRRALTKWPYERPTLMLNYKTGLVTILLRNVDGCAKIKLVIG